MKTFVRLILAFLFQTIIVTTCCYASGMNEFYLHPSYAAFKKELSEFSKSSKSNAHIKDLFSLFVVLVLKEHPNYIEELIKDYPKYSGSQKQLIADSLYFIRGKSILPRLNLTINDISSIPINPRYVDSISLRFPVKSDDDVDYNCKHTDYFWTAFFATGNKFYLTKILQFLSKEDLFIRTLAFEMLNRNFLANVETKLRKENVDPEHQDIFNAIKKSDPEGKKHFKERLVCYKIILWSLESNKHSYKNISEKIEEIIKSNPKLNYYQDVKL